MLRLTLAEQTFELLPQRALFWFEQRTLVISDPLFGKSTVYPSRGVPVPTSAKSSGLNRLTTLLNFFEPDLLLVLGDLVDPEESQDEEVLEGLLFWRRQFTDVNIFRIHQGLSSHHEFLHEFRMKESKENQLISPFEFQVDRAWSKGFSIAGRPHPAVKFLDRQEGTGVKAPCFHLSPASLTLPGFCSTSSATTIGPKDGDRLFIIGPNEVVELSPAMAMLTDPNTG